MTKQKINDLLQKILDFYLLKHGEPAKDNSKLDGMLLKALMKHKLIGRIDTANIQKLENGDTLGLEFFLELLIEKRTIETTFEKHLCAIQEIIQQFKLRGINEFPIVIKGVSVFGLTNVTDSIRRSGDIDLIYSDTALLESVLLELGYKKKEKFSDHEYCEMYNEEMIIEIHNYIPIMNYSEASKKKAKNAYSRNTNIFFELSSIETEKIYYDDIIHARQSCHLFDEELILNVHYQLIILSAHIFRNFVSSQFNFASNIIIAELLDIIDLLNHSSFSMERFETVVKETSSSHSIQFVGYLLERLFGEPRLKEHFSNNTDKITLFPKILQWSGAMYIPLKTEEFIYYSLHEMIENLVIEEVHLDLHHRENDISNIQRYNSHGLQNIKAVTVKLDNSALIFVIKLMDSTIDQRYEVFEIFIAGERCCFILEDDVITDEEKPVGCSWILLDNCTIMISIPIVLTNVYKNSEYCLVISVSRWGTGPVSTFLPIKLLRKED